MYQTFFCILDLCEHVPPLTRIDSGSNLRKWHQAMKKLSFNHQMVTKILKIYQIKTVRKMKASKIQILDDDQLF